MMKLLVFGNHTCANRGDAAILRGLLTWLRANVPGAEIVVNSRYPVAAALLMGIPFASDRLHEWHRNPSLPWKAGTRIARWGIPVLMALALRLQCRWISKLLPRQVREEIERMKAFDACIQVGGSFYIDLYGPGQFEQAFAALLADRPVLLAGHSMGPFDGSLYRWLAGVLLDKATWIALREEDSMRAITRSRLPRQKLHPGGDTAWLAQDTCDTQALARWVPTWRGKQPPVAVTLRDISHFSARLGVTQSEYEVAMAGLIDDINLMGHDVIAIATCTTMGGYVADDAAIARSVAGMLKVPNRFHLMVGEPNDAEIGQLLGLCALVVSTRLHGAIIAMNHGTPAFVIAYEHKSTGIMRQLGLGDLAVEAKCLLDGSASRRILTMLQSLETVRSRVADSVPKERERADQMLERLLSAISP